MRRAAQMARQGMLFQNLARLWGIWWSHRRKIWKSFEKWQIQQFTCKIGNKFKSRNCIAHFSLHSTQTDDSPRFSSISLHPLHFTCSLTPSVMASASIKKSTWFRSFTQSLSLSFPLFISKFVWKRCEFEKIGRSRQISNRRVTHIQRGWGPTPSRGKKKRERLAALRLPQMESNGEAHAEKEGNSTLQREIRETHDRINWNRSREQVNGEWADQTWQGWDKERRWSTWWRRSSEKDRGHRLDRD